MNHEQIENLKVGDVLQFHINGISWPPAPVVEIHARGVSIYGKAYVCFYQAFGADARISGSVSEGEPFYTLVC